jgi:hypothetical protein
MNNNQEITNVEQLKDIMFQLNEISSVLAYTYFRNEHIPSDEMKLLSDIQHKFSSAMIMMDHIVKPNAK